VFADRNQLENSLLNLALNARDAMSGHGRLSITVTNVSPAMGDAMHHWDGSGRDHVQISVTDTGCGMSAEVRDKALTPFFTTKEAGKGTGLGLSQVAGFATRSAGHCVIETALNRGTTITLCLPRYTDEAPQAKADKTTIEREIIARP
jgi:signal transduction histidine kinase